VLVVGCGGIGGVLATLLLRTGALVSIASTNDAIRAAWEGQGSRLDGKAGAPPLPPERVVRTASELTLPQDVVFVAVQPPQVDEVGASLLQHLTPNARVVCLSNGLCEDRLAAHLGPQRVVGAVVAWGARMLGPGDYVRTSAGGFRVGTLTGAPDPQLGIVQSLLGRVGPATITNNLRGARYTKLAINCAVSTLGTIGGSTVGELLVLSHVRALALDILAEAVRVARAERVMLETVAGFDLSWLVPEPGASSGSWRGAARHALLMALGARYRHLRSSMLAAIERGRDPAVDYLNGEIVERGKRVGVPTPVNSAARDLVWEIARGQRAAGPAALRRLREVAGVPASSPADARARV
jgi:2-dehydropantoate 2-reductase